MTNEKEPTKPMKRRRGVKGEKFATANEKRTQAEWKSSELEFRLAVSETMQRYENALVRASEGYRKAQLDLESRYRKMHFGIISDLNELAIMINTIDKIKDDGQYKLFFEAKDGKLGMRRVPRQCGYNPNGEGIEEKIVNKPN